MLDDYLNKLAREKLLGVMANKGNKQRVIPIQSVESFISQGFEYVAALPDEKAIVRVPFKKTIRRDALFHLRHQNQSQTRRWI